jgi:hypothetical protein
VFACFTGASLSQSRRSAPSTVGLNCRLGLCMLDCLGPHWASARLPSVLPPRKSPPDDRTATRRRQDGGRTATRQTQPADVGPAVNRAEYTLTACHTCHVQPPHSGWHPRLAPTAGMHLHSPLAPHERFSLSAPRKPPSRLIPTNPSSRRSRSPIGTRRHSQVLAAMAGRYVARVMEGIGLGWAARCMLGWSRPPGGSGAWRWAAAPGGSPPPALHDAPRSPPRRLFLLLNSHHT